MTIERLVRGRGFNEQYIDGEHLEQLIKHGNEDLEHPRDSLHYEEDGVDWDVEFETDRFDKLQHEEMTLYVFYDEENNPICGVKQFP